MKPFQTSAVLIIFLLFLCRPAFPHHPIFPSHPVFPSHTISPSHPAFPCHPALDAGSSPPNQLIPHNPQPPAPISPAQFHDQEWQRIVQKYRLLDQLQPTRNQANMDIVHYCLSIDSLDFSAETIYGTCTVTAKSLVNNYLNTDLNFSEPMTVDSVTMPGHSVGWTHSNDLIEITWTTPIDSGQIFTITVRYHGHPPSSGFGSFGWGWHEGTRVVWTLSEPTGSRDWWPCKDVPNDKADSVDVLIRTRDDFISTSNGLLQEVINHGDGTNTYHWHHGYPISTYLVSITSTNYQTLSDQYVTLSGDTMPITHYVYPEDYNDALLILISR
jgi:aminopeptidase N